MISPFIPFKVAVEQLPGWQTGELVRYGAILKHANTGKIVAHLQETGLLEQAVSGGTTLLGAAASPTSMVGVIQNEQIKARLDAMQSMMGGLQSLQLATLAISFVGIGVTVASTAMILNRFNLLDSTIRQLGEKVDALPAKWREMDFRKTIVDLQTCLDRLDESTARNDKNSVRRKVEEQLNYGFNHFADGARQVVLETTINAGLLQAFLACLSLCAEGQIKALLYLDEKKAALTRTSKHYEKFEELTWEIPQDILETRLGDGDNVEEAGLVTLYVSELRKRFATRPQLLSTLISQEISGREFLEQAKEEMEEPLLLLRA